MIFYLYSVYKGQVFKTKEFCNLNTFFYFKNEIIYLVPLDKQENYIICNKTKISLKEVKLPLGRVIVKKDFLEIKPEIKLRIDQERKKTQFLYDYYNYTDNILFKNFFLKNIQNPLKFIHIVSEFGKKRDYGEYKKNKGKFIFHKFFDSIHWGVDLRGVEGTEIYAIADGEIILKEELYLTGNTLIIYHGSGIFSLYAHLKDFYQQKSELVKSGDLIGFVGQTGRVSGPHLHFGIKIRDQWVDPLQFIDLIKELM